MRSRSLRRRERAISRPLPPSKQVHLCFLLPQQFAGTCRDAGFAALLPRDVFAGFAALLPCFAATARRFLRRARMKSLHRRRFSSALAHDSNLAEAFFVALMAALRCLRSAIALSVAVFFIQRVNKHRSQQTAAGIPPAPHGALAGVDKANYLSRVSHVSLAREAHVTPRRPCDNLTWRRKESRRACARSKAKA